jgi:hypothetical protein
VRLLSFLLVGLVACGGSGNDDEDAVTCGDATCGAGEFCLTEYEGDVESRSCVALPEACETAEQMCFDDPEPCAEDWATELCPGNYGSGCVDFGSLEVSCSYPEGS